MVQRASRCVREIYYVRLVDHDPGTCSYYARTWTASPVSPSCLSQLHPCNAGRPLVCSSCAHARRSSVKWETDSCGHPILVPPPPPSASARLAHAPSRLLQTVSDRSCQASQRPRAQIQGETPDAVRATHRTPLDHARPPVADVCSSAVPWRDRR
jgi:hypothetical protein